MLYKKFERLLHEQNITAYRVAKDTGISSNCFSAWKHGKTTPKFDKIVKIANYFNVPLEYFTKEND